MEWMIGIDLGTTNSTLSTMDKNEKKPTIEVLPISQQITSQMAEESFALPSFIYIPLEEEKKEPFAGIFARDRGSEVPDRVVHSAKSWLCQSGMDCSQAFLPLGECEKKISPIEASQHILNHLKEAWQNKHPVEIFEKQEIVIAVPASFDPIARQCVLTAAEKVGLSMITLIEEPLAAFYAWLASHELTWREQLKVGHSVLVIDVGGGTTDFTLIRVEEINGNLSLNRLAVGEHLLLGGDNIDLALAYGLQDRFNGSLDDWQFQALVHQCRIAKEILLSDSAPPHFQIVLPGRGSSLLGGMKSATVTREEMESLLMEGFFPFVSCDELVKEEKKAVLSQRGLSYARDPRLTVHLAAFLKRAGGVYPQVVLFNGGTMKASWFRRRILDQLSKWSGQEVNELPGADLDFAVSKGAAYYGWTKKNQGIRVKAGTTHSYFIGVETAAPAIPGLSPPLKAICVVPQGMEEGSEVVLKEQTFSLLLNESALFRFFSSHQSHLSGLKLESGTVIKNWKEELTELPTIETLLEANGEESKMIPIQLKAKVTEMGVLELWCEATNNRRWKLEYNLRSFEKSL